jgi:hypothetical protein
VGVWQPRQTVGVWQPNGGCLATPTVGVWQPTGNPRQTVGAWQPPPNGGCLATPPNGGCLATPKRWVSGNRGCLATPNGGCLATPKRWVSGNLQTVGVWQPPTVGVWQPPTVGVWQPNGGRLATPLFMPLPCRHLAEPARTRSCSLWGIMTRFVAPIWLVSHLSLPARARVSHPATVTIAIKRTIPLSIDPKTRPMARPPTNPASLGFPASIDFAVMTCPLGLR